METNKALPESAAVNKSELFKPETYDIYTEAKEAARELKIRQSDASLRCKVDEFVGRLPDCFPTEPFIFLARQVARVKFEDFDFIELSRQMELPPYWPTYQEDKFYTGNHDKRELVELPLFSGWGRNGGPRLKKLSIAGNINDLEGRRLSQIDTKWGESMIDFHMRVRRGLLGEEAENIFEFSEFALQWGGAKNYYPKLLALTLSHAILVEEFHGPESESLATFTEKIVYPAYLEVNEMFGIKPLIVRLPWDVRHQWYPAELEAFL